MTEKTAFLPRPVRLRAALRQAIDIRIVEGKTVVAACLEAGMSTQGYHKAMKRPEVLNYYQEKQIEFVASMDSDKAVNQVRAYIVGIELMENSKSDTVKARMVEFFLAGNRKPPQVTINNVVNSGGYEYARPDQRVVDILDAQEVHEVAPKEQLN